MAVDQVPFAFVDFPIAVEYCPLACVDVPIAVDQVPLALTELPFAINPLDVIFPLISNADWGFTLFIPIFPHRL
ncbi:MAG: hypothetical protein WCH65_00745 [bacterium]